MAADNPLLDPALHKVQTKCRRYEGRVVVVTGAARGLGYVIAERVAQEGASVVLADIRPGAAEAAADRLRADTGARTMAFQGDLADLGVADEMMELTVQRLGRIDTLVNNAAALIRMRLTDFTEELLQDAVKWNVWTTLRCCKAVLPHMTRQQYGRIVNVGGEGWRTGTPFHTLLGGVGKGSMVGLTATIAGEAGADGITVNCVSPGAFVLDPEPEAKVDASFGSSTWTPPEILEKLKNYVVERPVGIPRAGHATEVAAAIAFFGSPECSYITGQHIGASGGKAMI